MLQAKPIEAGDYRTVLFNALCLRHKTGSFQTLEMLGGTFTHSPSGKAKQTFQLALRNADEYQRPDRLLLKWASHAAFFYLCLTWNWLHRRGKRGRVSLSNLHSRPLPIKIRDRGGEKHPSC
jgi:hypothetical protein